MADVLPQQVQSIERWLRDVEKRLERLERRTQLSGAANPDTTGATLPNLEIEVNQVKQLLRDVGHMAP